MQPQSFDFTADDTRAGFRLHRLELLNWGTFDRHVWRIEPGGDNALLTGDIGSGKSTLVDAITTLLVPHHRIVYNKAAGAEGKERSLYSYLRGEYKSEQDELTQSAKAVTLRDENSYSVLLGWFYNEGFDQGLTLAQVFWLRDGRRNPERFFVTAEAPLSISEDFSGFGSDILALKRRLRRAPQVTVLDNFKEYSARFRHLFGIQHEQALELFYQTVSMKSVGNLNEFVRGHMLERSDVEARIDELRRHFENLNRAHGAVLKAKHQIQRLGPLVEDGERHGALERSIAGLRRCREALVAYFGRHKATLLRTQIERLDLDLDKLGHRLNALQREIAAQRRQEAELKTSIDEHGGRRLQQLEHDIAELQRELERQRRAAAEYRDYARQLGLAAVHDEAGFFDNQRQARGLLDALAGEIETLDREKTDHAVDLREVVKRRQALEAEVASLRRRRSNIPLRNLEIRRELAQTLELDEAELPFVGELVQVDETESEWEGTIERLLHNFGLSLLVPDPLYTQVSRYVDRTHLKGRLVYFRVVETRARPAPRGLVPRSLVRKLRIKPDSPFYPWLERQLAERFNYSCCEDMEDFRRQPQAVTRQGQIKSRGQRHEKDDRRSLHDRSHYVLGWSNAAKIQALEAQGRELERQAQGLAERLARVQGRQQELGTRRDITRDLLKVTDFAALHWQPTAERIQALDDERRRIEASSDILSTLRAQLQTVQQAIEAGSERERGLGKEQGRLEERRAAAASDLQEAEALAALLSPEESGSWFPRLDEMRQGLFPGIALNRQNLDKHQRALREHIQRQLDNEEQRLSRLRDRITKQMQAYNTDYPAETSEVDVQVAALGEYAAMLRSLQDEDLPRHEARFKQLLNEGTIQGVAMFQNQLHKERQQIEEKIQTINISLREIEYNPGTYIRLVLDRSQDPEIRDFQEDLRQCLAQSLDGDELYNETKFLQVKAIIERFSGREGFVDLDRRWTRKVTDVRNWFSFSASERWLEDDREKEFYSDTAGKSGGQKEKLAYTILASALAYQFGLEWNAVTSRSFRFVVIDEAFGKGSDESTRYGLELFKKLNLQLLIVTPLQKIHIIEDYIAAVHFVHNQDGRNSVIRNLTVAEYQAEKRRYLQGL
jgi:uncharacterized protein YPO0396